MSDLRTKVAQTAHRGYCESGRRIAPDWDRLDKFEKHRWLELADRILAIPEIADAQGEIDRQAAEIDRLWYDMKESR